jgi:hypothetical protein
MSCIKTKARAWVVGVVAAAALVLSAANALAVFPDDHVASYAGCLSTAGSAAGTFSRVALGDAPASPCGSNQMLVHLSGGDITSVIAGPGLSGGGSNGSATPRAPPGSEAEPGVSAAPGANRRLTRLSSLG